MKAILRTALVLASIAGLVAVYVAITVYSAFCAVRKILLQLI